MASDNLLISAFKNGQSLIDFSRERVISKWSVYDRAEKLGLTNDNKKRLKIYHEFKNKKDIFIQNNKPLSNEDSKRLKTLLRKRFVFSKNSVKSKGRKYGFDLKLGDLVNQFNKQNGLCYYSNLPLEIIEGDSKEHGNPYILSIDRIDSKKGYIKSNVVLCCNAVNAMKNCLTLDKFYEFINALYFNKPNTY